MFSKSDNLMLNVEEKELKAMKCAEFVLEHCTHMHQ